MKTLFLKKLSAYSSFGLPMRPSKNAKASRILGFLLIVPSLLLASCVAPMAPSVQPFKDYNNYMVKDDFNYQIGTTSRVITVPAGFVTDYASIPGVVRPIAERKNKRYQSAAIVHDWLYWIGHDRREADDILYTACRELGVKRVDASLIWGAVRIGGSAAWNENQRERRDGFLRVIPAAYRDNKNWPDTWDGQRGLRQMLYEKGIREQSSVSRDVAVD